MIETILIIGAVLVCLHIISFLNKDKFSLSGRNEITDLQDGTKSVPVERFPSIGFKQNILLTGNDSVISVQKDNDDIKKEVTLESVSGVYVTPKYTYLFRTPVIYMLYDIEIKTEKDSIFLQNISRKNKDFVSDLIIKKAGCPIVLNKTEPMLTVNSLFRLSGGEANKNFEKKISKVLMIAVIPMVILVLALLVFQFIQL